MSSGCVLREYPSISVDNFDRKSWTSSVYFLSHAHQDHMVGLDSDNFYYFLTNRKDAFIYMSDLTRDVLVAQEKYKRLKNHTKVLSLDTPTQLNDVTVTAFGSGHCPGSVMFLFEGANGTVLCTGDFRYSIGQIQRVPSLHSGQSPKCINSIYLDTTFCSSSSAGMPTREQSCQVLFKLLDEILDAERNGSVLIKCKSQLGYEFLFEQLHDRYKMRVHVADAKLTWYQNAPSLAASVTSDSSSTRIHSCDSVGTCFHLNNAANAVQIIVSTLWFLGRRSQQDGADDDGGILVKMKPGASCRRFHSIYRLYYSFHSSLKEVQDVVAYLQPRNIYPIVIPRGHNSRSVVELVRPRDDTQRGGDAQPQSFEKLGQVQLYARRTSQTTGSDQDDIDLDFGESPVLKKKRST